MDLLSFADRAVDHPSFFRPADAAPRLWGMTADVLQNEWRTDSNVASVLSQVVLHTDEFDDLLARRGLDPRGRSGRDVLLIQRSRIGEYVLLVADEDLEDSTGPSAEPLPLSRVTLARGLERWQTLVGARAERARRADKDALSLWSAARSITPNDLTALSAQPFVAWFVKRPVMIPTNAPSPAWSVMVTGGSGRATAGCIVGHSDGRRSGVTSVRHLFGAGNVSGRTVTVDGMAGTVAEDDPVTDSVFIELHGSLTPMQSRGLSGCLKGKAPRLNDTASFEGLTSGAVQTAIQAIDPGVAQVSPYRQSKVYTPAVTNPGDSGAALIEDDSDHVVAFAHERTAAGSHVEWSSWIWADSVFSALGVSPK